MKSKNALLSLKAFPCICQNDCVICGTFIVEGRCQLFVIELLTEGACDWRGKWLLGLKMHNIFFTNKKLQIWSAMVMHLRGIGIELKDRHADRTYSCINRWCHTQMTHL